MANSILGNFTVTDGSEFTTDTVTLPMLTVMQELIEQSTNVELIHELSECKEGNCRFASMPMILDYPSLSALHNNSFLIPERSTGLLIETVARLLLCSTKVVFEALSNASRGIATLSRMVQLSDSRMESRDSIEKVGVKDEA